MTRWLARAAVLLLTVGLVSPGLGADRADAAALPAPYAASATSSVARVTTSLLGIPVAGLGLGQSIDAVDSGATPRASSTSRNVSAAVAGLPISVNSGSQTAPPDNPTPSTGSLLGVDAGILGLGALTRSNSARWSGDSQCVVGDALTATSTETAGLAVAGLLDVDAATADTRTDLVAGSGPLNRAVRARATGSVAGVDLLGGQVTVAVSQAPVLTATASGTAGGATVARNSPVVTVTGPGGPTVLQLGAQTSVTVDIGLSSATVSLSQPTNITQSANGQNASATWNFLNVQVDTVASSLTATLLPLTASATAPAGGLDCPPPAPVITTPAEGEVTDATPTISGTAEPGATVAVSLDGSALGTVTADGSGAWSIPVATALAEGSHEARATQTVNGATSPQSPVRTFTVDTTAPAAPVVVSPADGSTTGDSTPTYSGTAEAGATVEVSVDGTPVGTTTADGSGDWSLDQPTGLAEGDHEVYATATDAVGNVSANSNTNTFTVDLTAPSAPVVTAPADGSSTNDATPTYVGTADAGSTVEVFVDGASVGTTTASGAGDWSLDQPADLADGDHEVYSTATDAAGNVSPDSNTNGFTVDTTGPAAPVIVEPADGDVTNDATPTYVGTAEAGATVEVFVDGASIGTTTADGAGDWSLDQPAALAEGDHVVTAQGTDALGNTGPESAETGFSVDLTAPDGPVVTTPADGSSTNDPTPTYVGTAEAGATVEVFVDGASVGTTAADGAGDWSLDQPADLAEGDHEVYAVATDAAGNVSADSNTNTFTVDLTAPAAPVISEPADGTTTADASPTYVGTAEPDATVEVLVDGASVGTTTADGAGDWSLDQPAGLADGDHEVYATATDAAGNVSPDSNTNGFTVDTTGPAAPVIVEPADGDVTNDATPTYVGTAEPNATVEVFVDSASVGTTTADGAGDWSLDQPTVLADGDHVVTAQATDEAGNAGPMSGMTSFVVDTATPLAPVVTDPADGSSTNDPTPTYAGTAEADSTVEVFVDGTSVGTTAADGAGDWSLDQPADLAEGDHEVYAVATDAAGNVSPDSDTNAFTVDTVTPAAPVVTTPVDGSSSSDATPTYVGTAEPNATVEVFVDGASVGTTAADGAGDWSLDQPADLAEGDHEVYAVATDAAGNVSADSNTNTFTVDLTAPAAPVISEPADGTTTADASPTYVGTAEPNATVEVFVDGASVGTTTADGAGDWSLDQPTVLADGPHTATATATDGAGNVSPVSDTTTFTVDTTAPAPPVITSPTGTPTYPGPDVTVTGTGEPGASLDVTATSGGLTAGASTTVSGAGTWSVELSGLADGTWTASASQTDGAGNVSEESDPESFVVDSAAPEPPVIDPFDPAVSSDATPTITGTGEPGSLVTVTDIGTTATYGPVTVAVDGTWSVDVPQAAPLADGTHTFTATQEDAGGNESGPSAAEQYTVDATAPVAPVIVLPADGSTVTDPTPTVSGTAEPGSTVTVLVDGEPVGTATASGSGSWTFPLTTPLVDGPHAASATATDAVGNVSPATTSDFVVDTTSATPVVTSPADGSSTNDTTPRITGTADPGDVVTVTLDGEVLGTVTADEDGRWSVTLLIPLAEGPHTVSAQARDAVGNVSDVSTPVTFTVDVTAPEPPVIVTPGEGETTADPTPEVTGTGEPGATVVVKVDGETVGTTVVDADGTWSVIVPDPLGDGAHVVTATQTDAAGNVSDPDSVRFAVQAAEADGSGGGTPAGGSTTGGPGGSLARTGAVLLPPLVLGVALLAFGVGLVLSSRRRGRGRWGTPLA